MSTQHAPSSLRQALQELSTFLRTHNSDAPILVAQVLMMYVLQVDKIFLIAQGQQSISQEQWQKVYLLAQRHALGEPLAYILQKKEFFGRDFMVNEATLIPRPESEDVLEAVMHLSRKIPQYTLENDTLLFADIGTGSGCLACTFAAEIPYAQGFMLDISPQALAVAQHNAQALGVDSRIQALQSTLYALPFAHNSLHVLISNPPYVSQEEFTSLEKNVREFEPKTALVPVIPSAKTQEDPHGLAHLKALAEQAWHILRPQGLCIVEHGNTQGKAVRELFSAYGQWESVETGQDLAGLDRYCIAIKP